MLTAERLRAALDYDPSTGVFARKAADAGRPVGSRHSKGYIVIFLERRAYFAHRLAWLYVHGEWPPEQIDHIDGTKSNNRIDNLRRATNAQNQANIGRRRNNTSGYKGVCFHRPSGLWLARLYCGGRQLSLGYFATAEEAAAKRRAAAEAHYGEFSRES